MYVGCGVVVWLFVCLVVVCWIGVVMYCFIVCLVCVCRNLVVESWGLCV